MYDVKNSNLNAISGSENRRKRRASGIPGGRRQRRFLGAGSTNEETGLKTQQAKALNSGWKHWVHLGCNSWAGPSWRTVLL